MELLELKDRVLELFNTDIDHLGDALLPELMSGKIEVGGEDNADA